MREEPLVAGFLPPTMKIWNIEANPHATPPTPRRQAKGDNMEYTVRKAFENLKKHRKRLTRQQYSTLKGQIIAGDSAGAMKGLWRLLKKEEACSTDL